VTATDTTPTTEDTRPRRRRRGEGDPTEPEMVTLARAQSAFLDRLRAIKAEIDERTAELYDERDNLIREWMGKPVAERPRVEDIGSAADVSKTRLYQIVGGTR
jgi:hypothetical protein